MEVMSFSLVCLIAIPPRFRFAVESSIKYFCISAVAGAFFCLGLWSSGTSVASFTTSEIVFFVTKLTSVDAIGFNLITFSFICFLMCFFLKLYSAPIHL